MPTLNDKSYMPFGIHKDKELGQIPVDYFKWLWETRYNSFAGPGSSDLAKWLKNKFENKSL